MTCRTKANSTREKAVLEVTACNDGQSSERQTRGLEREKNKQKQTKKKGMPASTQSRTLGSHDKNTGRGGHDPNKSLQDKESQVARAEGDPHCRVSL